MLSASNSLDDVKLKLEEDYDSLGFASEAAMDNAINSALDDVKLLYLYPVTGSASYAIIAAKDKVSLSEKEEYLYWSEVYYACFLVIKKRVAILATTKSDKSRERLEVEGYQYEFSTEAGNSAITEMGVAVREFYDKAVHFMCIAGYNPHNLQKGGSLFADSGVEFLYGDIV